uniref:Uncharacterized protein n=1 Tax=Siphoviridae sp. ctUWs1 TaxID=2826352 RepID=A0A8S5QUP2_9CAUD|nr:MAG TPA: hypothetical protein [Siphoviridae sp. ctUWs1]
MWVPAYLGSRKALRLAPAGSGVNCPGFPDG